MSDIIRPEVRDGFRAFTQQFEGDVPFMYCDIKALVTTGVGNLIDPIGPALVLPWRCADGSPAAPADIISEWHRVKAIGVAALPRGLAYPHYHSAEGLYLDADDIAALVMSRLDANAVELVKHLPNFASYPVTAQTAILSMAWAMGAGFPLRWPNLSAAARMQAWTLAAESCFMHDLDNIGVRPRNRANISLFLQASGLSVEDADRGADVYMMAHP